MTENQARLSSNSSFSARSLAFWGGIFLVSRIPFILPGSGYGLDPDAYYVLLSAQKMLTTGRYWMSRPPGYPLFEILCAVLFKGGPVVTNGMTALISCLSLFPLTGIMRLISVKNRGWFLAAFCFAPILWIQSICTMDYMWALFFIIMAYYFFLNRKYCRGAIFLGIAVGFRITSGIIILPLSLQFIIQERTLKRIITPLLLFGLVCLLVYAPVFLSYGFSFWRYVPYRVPWYVWGYKTLSELFGFPAFLILISGTLIFLFTKDSRRLNEDALVPLLIIVTYSLLFVKLPAETAYLVPVIPFGLILLDKMFSRRLFILFCLFFVLNGVISTAIIDKQSYRRIAQVKPLFLDYGVVVKNEIRRNIIYQNAKKLSAIAEALPGNMKTAIIITWYEPVFHFLNQDTLEKVKIGGQIPALKRTGRDLYYLEAINEQGLLFLRDRQFSIYYLDAARRAKSLAKVNVIKYARPIAGINSYPVNY